VIEALVRLGKISLVRRQVDVFDRCTGISLTGWKLARWLYTHGASSPIVGAAYRHIRERSDYNKPSLAMRLLGRSIVREFGQSDNPLLVSHPTLVGMLAGRPNLIYQHGELVAPRESVVRGASLVCVPTHEVAEPFVKAGYSREQLLITGLCIEPPIAKSASDAFVTRISRLKSDHGLCGAFFSSGAEPQAHIETITTAAISALGAGGKAIIFARHGGELERLIRAALKRSAVSHFCIDAGTAIPLEIPDALLVTYHDRREENNLTALLFHHFDYLVAPSHERVNWTLGLGLPMFALTPAIGPFAPLNLNLVLDAGVARTLERVKETAAFGGLLVDLQRSGKLAHMADHGWGIRDINGFTVIADYLASYYSA
jgi:hypothetical protein